MKILITGGSTLVPIDKVRGITNIFRGRTAVNIANEAIKKHKVTLLNNSPMQSETDPDVKFIAFKTYDELYSAMEKEITKKKYDVIIHSAAISDYQVSEVLVGEETYRYGDRTFSMKSVDNSAKIKSNHSDLFLKLKPTEKIIDKIRDPWGFKGILVKFKLQVGMKDEELIEIAKKSREASNANIMIANCLEWSRERAYVITGNYCYEVDRKNLYKRLIDLLETY